MYWLVRNYWIPSLVAIVIVYFGFTLHLEPELAETNPEIVAQTYHTLLALPFFVYLGFKVVRTDDIRTLESVIPLIVFLETFDALSVSMALNIDWGEYFLTLILPFLLIGAVMSTKKDDGITLQGILHSVSPLLLQFVLIGVVSSLLI